MPELICHLVGDFCLQNHFLAAKKTSSWAWAAVHVLFYMLPFLVLTRSPAALAVMAGTHLVIDRYRLAKYWVAFWGVGCEGLVARTIRCYRDAFEMRGVELHGDAKLQYPKHAEPRRPEPAPAPDFLAVWLLILVDNTAHLAINHAAIAWL